jgi:hypothetical protein
MDRKRVGFIAALISGVFAITLAACGGGGGGTTPPAPNIVVTDSVVSNSDLLVPFGTVILNSTSDQTVTVTNTGTADLIIGTIAGPAAPFSITTTCSNQAIAPGGTCTETVQFAPTETGSFNGSFDIPSNDPDTPTITVAISGTGVSAGSSVPAPLASPPETGQTVCYSAAGTVIPCAGTGQDGELQKGAPWPSPRFTNADGTTPVSGDVVVDQLTGLMWSRATGTGPVACGPYQSKFWPNALDQIACLNTNSYLGYSNWRLPNINELRTLVHRGENDTYAWLNNQGFNLSNFGNYWASTTYATEADRAWYVEMRYGIVYHSGKYFSYTVLPVRDAQTGAPFNVAKTGQAECYDGLGTVVSCTNAGQDGSYQKGTAWPSLRFTAKPDTTISDNLTGLIWVPDASIMKTRDSAWDQDLWTNDGLVYWQHALDYIAKLNAENYLGHNDWRLPNANELASLMHFGEANPAVWLNSQGFSNLATIYSTYWTSTTYSDPVAKNDALFIRIDTPMLNHAQKGGNGFAVWPVRGGQ